MWYTNTNWNKSFTFIYQLKISIFSPNKNQNSHLRILISEQEKNEQIKVVLQCYITFKAKGKKINIPRVINTILLWHNMAWNSNNSIRTILNYFILNCILNSLGITSFSRVSFFSFAWDFNISAKPQKSLEIACCIFKAPHEWLSEWIGFLKNEIKLHSWERRSILKFPSFSCLGV